MKKLYSILVHVCCLIPAVCFCALAFLMIVDGAKNVADELGELGPVVAGVAEPDYLLHEVEIETREESRLHLPIKEMLAAMDSAVGKAARQNFSFVKDEQGFLHSGDFYLSQYADMMAYAKRIREVDEATAAPLLFVGGTDRYTATKAYVQRGYPVDRYAKLRMDELLLDLFMNGVDTLDLSTTDLASMPAEALYAKTGGNITTEASFAAFAIVVDELEERYGIVIDEDGFYTDVNNYSKTVYSGMAGELSKSAGVAFGGTEDFTVLTPKFETLFSVSTPNADNILTIGGDFSQALLRLDKLRDNDARTNHFEQTYLDAGVQVRTITNHLRPSGAAVLLVCDESFLPFAAFLSASCSVVTVVMPLEYTGTVDVAALAAEQSYDCVLVAFAPESISAQAFAYTDTPWTATYNRMEVQADA